MNGARAVASDEPEAIGGPAARLASFPLAEVRSLAEPVGRVCGGAITVACCLVYTERWPRGFHKVAAICTSASYLSVLILTVEYRCVEACFSLRQTYVHEASIDSSATSVLVRP